MKIKNTFSSHNIKNIIGAKTFSIYFCENISNTNLITITAEMLPKTSYRDFGFLFYSLFDFYIYT